MLLVIENQLALEMEKRLKASLQLHTVMQGVCVCTLFCVLVGVSCACVVLERRREGTCNDKPGVEGKCYSCLRDSCVTGGKNVEALSTATK